MTADVEPRSIRISVADLVAAQIEALEAVDELATLLSPPEPNNFVLRMIPRTRDAMAQYRYQADATAWLNHADERLMAFSATLLDELDARTDTFGMRRLHAAWRTNFDEGDNLLGCRFAAELAHAMAGHLDLPTVVASRAPEILEGFCDVPAPLTEVVRLNLYVPFRGVLPVVRALVAATHSHGVLHAVERLEVAKRLDLDDPTRSPGFPTLIVYFGLTEVDRPDVVAMRDVLRIANTVLDAIALPPPPGPTLAQYALPWHPAANLTQGFRLHKQYLDFLGVLDRVFEPRSGGALVRLDHAADATFCRAVRLAAGIA